MGTAAQPEALARLPDVGNASRAPSSTPVDASAVEHPRRPHTDTYEYKPRARRASQHHRAHHVRGGFTCASGSTHTTSPLVLRPAHVSSLPSPPACTPTPRVPQRHRLDEGQLLHCDFEG